MAAMDELKGWIRVWHRPRLTFRPFVGIQVQLRQALLSDATQEVLEPALAGIVEVAVLDVDVEQGIGGRQHMVAGTKSIALKASVGLVLPRLPPIQTS